MADQTRSSIDIDAAPAQVMAVIADFEHYPDWVDSLSSATVLSVTDGRPDQVRMVLDHPVIKDTYTLGYRWQGDERVSWSLVEGQLIKAMDGSYAVAAKPGAGRTGSTVTYTLSVDLSIPMLGMIKRRAEKTIIDGALTGLKNRVEG